MKLKRVYTPIHATGCYRIRCGWLREGFPAYWNSSYCAGWTTGKWEFLTLVGPVSTVKSDHMSVKKIQLGQLWKKEGTPDVFLVTRVYNEALSTIAALRKSGAEEENLIRVKVERAGTGVTLPGFIPAVDDD